MISFLSHSEQPDPTLGKYCVRSAVSSGLVPGNFGNSILEKTQPSENTRGRLQYLELCSFGLNYSAEIILKVCSLSCFIPIFLDLGYTSPTAFGWSLFCTLTLLLLIKFCREIKAQEICRNVSLHF